MPLLECQNLTKIYNGNLALNAVNLTLEPGRIIGLLGPNGSGKTTLIKLANGLLTPTSGQILIEGQTPGVASKKVVSYLPERTYFDDNMLAKDCVSLFSDFYADFQIDKAYDMMSALQINPNMAMRAMSKGTREKIQLVLVMSRKAHLYLLDEPIGGVDPAARDYILSTIITNYHESGSVIISTHLIADVESVLDDVVFLNQGNIHLVSSVDAIRQTYHKSVDEYFREVYRCY